MIYNSKTSYEPYRNIPKLKYYAKCPNCGFRLNDEASVNNYYKNQDYSNVSNDSAVANVRGNYGAYDYKTFIRNDKKDKDIYIRNTNSINKSRHSYYNQNSSQNSFKYLQKDKDKKYIPNNNIHYYESFNSRKSKLNSNYKNYI